jgi:hypothetical protein
MKLSDLCEIKTNFPEADFWLVRKGSEDSVGYPVKDFNPEHIGIKVTATDILLPEYLYYVMLNLFNQEVFKNNSYGTLNLKNIRVEDVRGIRLR